MANPSKKAAGAELGDAVTSFTLLDGHIGVADAGRREHDRSTGGKSDHKLEILKYEEAPFVRIVGAERGDCTKYKWMVSWVETVVCDRRRPHVERTPRVDTIHREIHTNVWLVIAYGVHCVLETTVHPRTVSSECFWNARRSERFLW